MSSTSDSCKDSASKSNDDGECELEEKLQNISMADISVCANCGKEGSSDNMNTCNKCKQVQYCNAVCKKVHEMKHKKDCEEHQRRAAELHDEKLFKQPPPAEDCPICFLRIPTLDSGKKYNPCCGKLICTGCDYAPVYDNQGNVVAEKKCPYCRTPASKSEKEAIERLRKRVKDDAFAMQKIGFYYYSGTNGYPCDYTKALEYWHRAGELGHAEAYTNIGYSYQLGEGVEVDKKKANHYYELAAMAGDVCSRYNLGVNEKNIGNFDRALKHHMIAVRAGDNDSLKKIKELYGHGHATKEDYTKALRLYQTYLGEIKSSQRDEAAAAREDYRYC